ncbi:MAG: glutamate formiminotransferase / 5-formyltetrahydrofolate cyclo-ligase [Candidatus Atribacteria bacterium]|nr:glutamate formiminotransferase / 5-formyltetrahydrofolate cyclo-ligase [Candidatus Atribacteria bacterium]
MKRVIQSAINLSTSESSLVEKIVKEISNISGLKVADCSSDSDHNRSVVTLLGGEESLERAVLKIVEIAAQEIDISRHRGEHPRVGAVDVIPFTPWQGVDMEDCKKLAWKVGKEIAEEFSVPVYFYGEAALREEHRDLSHIRRGGYELLKEEIDKVPERYPDVGPAKVHPMLGAVVIGARGPLVAFNVNLKTQDLEVAKKIARKLRGETGGLSYVKAIGVNLKSKDMVQVSMNLLDFRKSTIYQTFELVKLEAKRWGVEVTGGEIIGLVPLEALVDIASFYLGIPELSIGQVLEYHLSDY